MIRFTKTVAGDRGVFRNGEEHELGAEYEALMIGADAAVPVGPVIEAAVAEEAPENAAVATTKPTRKRGRKARK